MSDQVETAEPVSTADAKRRGQAIAGALAGVGVLALLVAVFVIVKVGGDDTPTPAAAPPPATAPADPGGQVQPSPEPSEPAAPPAEPPAGAANLDPALQKEPVIKPGKGAVTKLKVTSLIKGTGPAVKAGQQITVNYVGATYADAKTFDSSWSRNEPLQTPIGVGQLIPGWDQGLVGVPVGSRVQLDIPANLAYGEKPAGGAPAGALRFVVDILQANG